MDIHIFAWAATHCLTFLEAHVSNSLTFVYLYVTTAQVSITSTHKDTGGLLQESLETLGGELIVRLNDRAFDYGHTKVTAIYIAIYNET